MIKQIKSSEIKKFVESNPNTILLDVRTEDEWNTVGKPDTKDLGIKSFFITISQDPSFLESVKKNIDKKNSMNRSLDYMELKPDVKVQDIKIDKVFIGSCTNGRIEDLREAAQILKNKKKASHVHGMVVPGSGLVKEQAEQEGLDKIFIESGFEWREPGCSMCLAMNADKLKPQERCASTSNRNFEGRQGRGGRTHLVSPGMAAAAAIAGNLDDVRKYQN